MNIEEIHATSKTSYFHNLILYVQISNFKCKGYLTCKTSLSTNNKNEYQVKRTKIYISIENMCWKIKNQNSRLY